MLSYRDGVRLPVDTGGYNLESALGGVTRTLPPTCGGIAPPAGGGANRMGIVKSSTGCYYFHHVENCRVYDYVDNLRQLAAGG